MTIHKINTKTIARIAAIQTFYQYHLDDDHDIDLLMNKTIGFYQDKEFLLDLDLSTDNRIKIKPSVTYLRELVKLTSENTSLIDQVIIDHLTDNNTIANLSVLLLALLRVAVCELKYFPEIPRKVIINEYTDIASDMITEHEVGFVNSMLDNIAKGNNATRP